MSTATINLDVLKNLNDLGLEAKDYLLYHIRVELDVLLGMEPDQVRQLWHSACQKVRDSSIMRQVTDSETMRRLLATGIKTRPNQ